MYNRRGILDVGTVIKIEIITDLVLDSIIFYLARYAKGITTGMGNVTTDNEGDELLAY
jgi:catabolite regulation protein CreA